MPASEYVLKLREKVGHELIFMPAAAGVVLNAAGEVLLQQRADSGRWGLPGGMIEPGEEPAQAVVREVLEETGLRVKVERLTGVYGGHKLMGEYANGDRYAYIAITFLCKVVGGELHPDSETDDETRALRWYPTDVATLPDNMISNHHERIRHAVDGRLPWFAKE